jgi:hypothetical protein
MIVIRRIVHVLVRLLQKEAKFALKQGMNAQRANRGIVLLFLLTSAFRLGWVVNATLRPLCIWERDPVPIL